MALKVDYKNDILASSMGGKRQYNMITNPNGTVSFEDVTDYDQEGDTLSAGDINTTNAEINGLTKVVISSTAPSDTSVVWIMPD